MTALYLEALVAIAASLSVLMAGAWVVQQRTGNSGWVDTIWTFSLGLVGVGSALWPIEGAPPNARQWLVAALVAIWSLRLGIHIAVRTAGISDDPRYAAFAREWGADSPAEDVHLSPESGARIDPAGIRDLCRRAHARRRAAAGGLSGRADPVDRHCRRGAGGCATQGVPNRPRQQGAGFATSGCGAGRAIPITSSNGSGGWPIPSSAFRSATRCPIRGVSPRCWARSSCTGSWSTSPASRHWKRRCCARAAIAIATTSRAPAAFFPRAAAEGSGHLSFAFTISGTVQKAVVSRHHRAAINRQCLRTALPAKGNSESALAECDGTRLTIE